MQSSRKKNQARTAQEQHNTGVQIALILVSSQEFVFLDIIRCISVLEYAYALYTKKTPTSQYWQISKAYSHTYGANKKKATNFYYGKDIVHAISTNSGRGYHFFNASIRFLGKIESFIFSSAAAAFFIFFRTGAIIKKIIFFHKTQPFFHR